MSMERVLNDINGVAGVTGSFVCGAEGNVLLSAMPGEYSRSDLAAVGRILSQTMAGLFLARRKKVRDLDFIYDQARLVVKSSGKGCLCIVGSADLNLPFLNLTADLAIRELRQAKDEISPAPAAPGAPSPEPPAPRAPIETLIAFLELLLQELDRQGTARENLFKILRHRSRKLAGEYPFLEGFVSPDDKLEPGALPLETREPKEVAEALAALVHGLCFSLRGMMGEAAAEATYLEVYDPYYAEHRPDFVALGLGDRLRKAVQQPLPSAHSGVDIHLD